jgi:hypothetical protein
MVWLAILATGCGEEPGRARVKRDEVVGVYEAKFQHGLEKLELKSDRTYIQEFISENGPVYHSGRWTLTNNFFDGSDVVLYGALVSEDEAPGLAPKMGDRTLNVHRRSGNLTLALNEAADWYFVRAN